MDFKKLKSNLSLLDVPDRIVTQALLVVAESVAALKAIVVPRLGRLIPAIIKVLSENQEADYRLLAALTAIHKVYSGLEHLIFIDDTKKIIIY